MEKKWRKSGEKVEEKWRKSGGKVEKKKLDAKKCFQFSPMGF